MALSLPILTFHDLDERPSVISIVPGVFQRSMKKLHESGYRTITLMDAVKCLSQGNPFPNRSFVVTFDDGYQSVYDEAFPVLHSYGMSATIFLSVGKDRAATPDSRLPAIDGRSMLNWREIKEMNMERITFGAHTLTHPDLTRLPLDRVEAEICGSKTIIEDALSTQVSSFAYPYGRYNRRCRDIVQQYFACACSDKLGLVTTDSDLYALERVDAYYLRTERLFDVMLTRLFPWYILACSIPRRIRRAIQPI